jgi:hypothetical protein
MDLNKKETAVNLVIVIGAATFCTFGVIFLGITTVASYIA